MSPPVMAPQVRPARMPLPKLAVMALACAALMPFFSANGINTACAQLKCVVVSSRSAWLRFIISVIDSPFSPNHSGPFYSNVHTHAGSARCHYDSTTDLPVSRATFYLLLL